MEGECEGNARGNRLGPLHRRIALLVPDSCAMAGEITIGTTKPCLMERSSNTETEGKCARILPPVGASTSAAWRPCYCVREAAAASVRKD